MHHGTKLPVFHQLQSKPPPAFRQDPVHMGATMILKVLRWRPTTNGLTSQTCSKITCLSWLVASCMEIIRFEERCVWSFLDIPQVHELRSQAAGLAGPGPAQKMCMRSTGSTLLICWCDVNLFAPHHLGLPLNPHSAPTEINSKHCLSLPHPRYQQELHSQSSHASHCRYCSDFALFHRHTRSCLACLEDHFALPGVLVASDQPNRVAPGQAIHRIWSTSCAEPGNPWGSLRY